MLQTTLKTHLVAASILLGFFFVSPVSALSSYQIGDTTYYSDGSSSYDIGDYTYYTRPNGQNGSMYDIGGTTYHSDNYGNSGSAYRIGGTTYFTDNQGNNISAYNIGDTTYYSDNKGNSGNSYDIGGTTYYNGSMFDDSGYNSNPPMLITLPTPVNSNNYGVREELVCPPHSYPDPDGISCRCMYGYAANGTKCVWDDEREVAKNWGTLTQTDPAASVDATIYEADELVRMDTTPLNSYGILGFSAPLRKCADESCGIIRYYAETSEINIIGKQGAWYLVSGTIEPGGAGSPVNGWINQSAFSTTTLLSNDVGQITDSEDFRPGSGTESKRGYKTFLSHIFDLFESTFKIATPYENLFR